MVVTLCFIVLSLVLRIQFRALLEARLFPFCTVCFRSHTQGTHSLMRNSVALLLLLPKVLYSALLFRFMTYLRLV